VIGPYKLVQPIGEGGMGTVYMAEQTRPVKRLVALKLIKAGLDSRQVLARFEAERQALALMDHPNIAKVLDAGATEQGRPYFVMELVKGLPITQFCDERRLTPRERLELAIPVCQAVQHAHQKGVIHRDLKPSNVLVALYDDRPVPKVIDFGIAKATGPRLTEQTLYTEFGSVVGTLEYMSPEQAQLNQLDIDTRSDIYSLGVLLYELLTGTTPLQRTRLKEAAFLEMLRVIREEEPPRPSTRLGTTEELPSIAARRNIEPRRLSGLVRGELDWIVMKALEKDRNRRYETASGLAADLRRYLDEEPVQAGPPSAAYRFRKFARRNKVKLAMATVVATALVLVAVGLAISAATVWRANRGLQQALDREREALGQKREALDREQSTTYFQRIALAERELATNHGARAEELLDQCPPDQRGWEWRLLRRRLHEEPLVLTGHPSPVGAVAFSPDGRVLAAGARAVRLWDPTTGRLLRTLTPIPENWTHRIVFGPDGRLLAAANWDGTVIVWDLTADRSRVLEAHAGRVNAIALHPDGRHLASVGADPNVVIWDLVVIWGLKDQDKTIFARDGDEIWDVAYSPDGTRLAWTTGDHTVSVCDARTGEPIYSRTDPRFGPNCVRFSPDGRTLAIGGARGVQIWDAATWHEVRELRGHTGGVEALAFSPDSRRLASGGGDTTVRLWDLVAGQEALTLGDHAGEIYGLDFSPDGGHLASAGGTGKGSDNTVRIWNATPVEEEDPEPIRTDAGHTRDVWDLSFSRDGRLLASASDDKDVRVRVAATGEVIRTLPSQISELEGVAFNPDGTRLAAVGGNGIVDAWDVRTGRKVWGAPRRTGPVNLTGIAWSPDGRHLAVADHVGVYILDAATGRELPPLDLQVGALGVAYRPGGRRLAVACLDKTVRVWDTDSRTMQTLSGHEAHVRSVAYHSDGRYLASAGEDGLVIVWDATDADRTKLERPIRAHRDIIESVAFSPDGRLLATGGRDGTVKIWDPATGALRRLIRARQQGVHAVAYHPEGKILASAGADGTVKLWAVPASRELPDQTR
jgi:WD40 repeat protein